MISVAACGIEKRAELLRPDAFTKAELRRIKTITNPDFEALYQQFLGESASIRIRGSDFPCFTVAPPDAPVVISVDPGHRPGPGDSFTVMQALCSVGNDYFVLDTMARAGRYRQGKPSPKNRYGKLSSCGRFDRIVGLWAGSSSRSPEAVSLTRHTSHPYGSSVEVGTTSLPHRPHLTAAEIRLPQDAPFREVWDAEFEGFRISRSTIRSIHDLRPGLPHSKSKVRETSTAVLWR